MTTEELLLLVANGDRDAFAQLYDEVAGRVYGLIRRIVRDPAISEEVAQEALLAVWRTAPRYEPSRGSADAWITVIAHRRAVDRVRSEQASRNRVARVAAKRDSVVPDPVLDSVEKALERTRVRQAIDTLSPSQRQVLTLTYFEGKTQREVAALTDVPIGTVKSRTHTALIALRRSLADLA